MKKLRDASIETLEQVRIIVRACSEDNYNQPSEHSPSGIGKHIRHILDHFLAVRTGVTNGVIDYNCRNRECDLENLPELALDLTNELINWLSNTELEDQSVQIVTEISVSDTQNEQMDSTLSREICYLINHTIHHVAYATLVASQNGIVLQTQLGLAPATATYLRNQNSSSSN